MLSVVLLSVVEQQNIQTNTSLTAAYFLVYAAVSCFNLNYLPCQCKIIIIFFKDTYSKINHIS